MQGREAVWVKARTQPSVQNKNQPQVYTQVQADRGLENVKEQGRLVVSLVFRILQYPFGKG